jgi:hypothetical protein
VDYIVEGDFSSHVQLGSFLPSFTIRCVDINDHPTIPRENYEVELQAEGLNCCALTVVSLHFACASWPTLLLSYWFVLEFG